MIRRAVCDPMRLFCSAFLILLACDSSLQGTSIAFDGKIGPVKGKSVVLVAADDEYHSEEAILQLSKILARLYGFTCTVLFLINPKDGTIDPHERRNVPGLEALQKADL